MVRDGVPVGPELAALVARRAGGERFDVRAQCALIGVSTSTFYKYLARFKTDGVEGFYPRSRRPRSSPQQLDPAWEEHIVRARKELIEQGWDAGADQIRFWLHDQHDPGHDLGHSPGQVADWLPSRATINRVLERRGQLISMPQRRPKRTARRFEAEHPNGRWQMDGLKYRLARGQVVVIVHIIDDCSRFEIALHAARSENATDVWATVQDAASRHGLPAELLTDNGTAFSGRRRGWTSNLEANMTALGVRHVTSSIAHPQTCGKVERAHQPLLQWLDRHGPYEDLPALQHALDTYKHAFNHDRRKTHLQGLTPAQRYALAPIQSPSGPLAPTLQVRTAKTDDGGHFTIDRISVGIGRAHARKTLTLFRRGNTITIFDQNTLITDLELDHRKHYQSSLQKRRLSTKS
jgi:transposase InsO family protein